MSDILRPVLDWIYSWAANYGWAIVIFTILIRMVMLPLDIKNRKGMIKMQQMQPKIAELQRKYGNDQQKMQQKQMQLFKEEHYSPFSGCLPLLITWPIFIIMFNAMRGVANEQMVSQLLSYIAGETPQHANWLWVKNLWMADTPFASVVPTMESLRVVPLDIWNRVISALSPEQLAAVTANIPNFTETLFSVAEGGGLTSANLTATIQTLVDAAKMQPAYASALETAISGVNFLFIFTINIFRTPNGYLILPVLAVASQMLMTKFSGAAQPANQPAAKDPKAAAAQQQSESMSKFMKYFFPIFTGWICLTSNASFALYWVTSNIVAGISNYLITKHFENKTNTLTVQGEVK